MSFKLNDKDVLTKAKELISSNENNNSIEVNEQNKLTNSIDLNEKNEFANQRTTLGIRTTQEIKTFFEQDVPGTNADEKIRNLKDAFEKMKYQDNTHKTGITDYIKNIENILSSVNVQLVAIDNVFKEKERQIKDDYIELIDKKIQNIEAEFEDVEELKSKVEYLNKENKNLSTDVNTLASNLKEKEKNEALLKEENSKIQTILDKNQTSIIELKSENSELLKKVTFYMEQNQVKDAEYESKLEDLKKEYKELEISSSIKDHKIETLENENTNLKEDLKQEKEELKAEIKELSKEHKEEIKKLNETISKKNLEIEALTRKILELEIKNK